jgi:hypothetical protein
MRNKVSFYGREKNTRQFTPNLAEFSRDMPFRLMFANIGVESSKLATFRWMTG